VEKKVYISHDRDGAYPEAARKVTRYIRIRSVYLTPVDRLEGIQMRDAWNGFPILQK
jgi:hypothetical protein